MLAFLTTGPFGSHRPGLLGKELLEGRISCWRDWLLWFFSDDLWAGCDTLTFPSIERLILDFTEWQLAKEDGLQVSQAIVR